ncbi:unnamed protein product [Linum tenue]|uniref:FAD-binding PCMH-type domain-containing protein n=1 Tax=Linum tenue TaxID=586396 RepID=A0AAV0QLF0_9ROSI|nr:unnamed protein product [Linum tenue]
MTNKSSCLVSAIVSVLLVQLLFSPSSSLQPLAFDDSSVYETFLQCLESYLSPNDQISNLVFTSTNSSYTSVLQAYKRNARFNSDLKPLIIVTPTSIPHVQYAVLCTRRIGYRLRIRSGGHDFEGLSYVSDSPFFLIDMSNLRSIEVNIETNSAWVQSGAILGEVYHAIWEKSKVHGFPAGVCPTVAVGGHFSGGGYGNMMRKFGLSVDHIVDAQIVDANGDLLDRKSMGEGLFWAIRGGGGASFGIVISYKIELVEVPETVTVFQVESNPDEGLADFVYRWQFVAPTTSNDLFMRLHFSHPGSNGTASFQVSIQALYLGKADDVVSLLSKDFPELGLKRQDCTEMSWIESVLWYASLNYRSSPKVLLDRKVVRSPNDTNSAKRKSDFVVNPVSREGLGDILKRVAGQLQFSMAFSPHGGEMSEIPASSSPFPHRAGNLYKIEYVGNWNEAGEKAERAVMTQLRRMYSFMAPLVSKNPRRAYVNYRDLDIGKMSHGKGYRSYEEGKVYGMKYFHGNFDRLVKVKTEVDPANFFRDEQSIPTLPMKL